MRTSEDISKITAALVAAKRAFPRIIKDSDNPYFKSRYASLSTIMDAISGPLLDNGLVVVHGAELVPTENPVFVEQKKDRSTESRMYLRVTTRLVHAQSGQWIESHADMPMPGGDPQAGGSAMSYGRRYGVSALLALVTDDDDDGNAASGRSVTQHGAVAVPPPSAKPKPDPATMEVANKELADENYRAEIAEMVAKKYNVAVPVARKWLDGKVASAGFMKAFEADPAGAWSALFKKIGSGAYSDEILGL